MRKVIPVVFLLLYSLIYSLSLWAQRQTERPYWYSLEQGKQLFRNGDYGNALMAFEDARRDRRDMYTRMKDDMITLLSIPEVRRMGDSLALIEPYITDRYHINAGVALQEVYYRVPKTALNGSANRVLEELERLKAFPEAEYWLGETYRVEGELEVALDQYQKAHEQRDFLENPAFDTEILYRMVDLLKIKQEYDGMEARAMEILAQDSLYLGPVNTLVAMARILNESGINRLLTVYRHNNTTTERAYRLLGLHYYATSAPRPEGYAAGRLSPAAEYLMIAFLAQNTVLIQELVRHQYDFGFSTLDALITSACDNPVLAAYMADCEYYKTVYYFAAALYADGKTVLGRRLWTLLSLHPEAGEWNKRSTNQLRSPFLDKP
jgi:tetratricopeptide (TPR) repeat protein